MAPSEQGDDTEAAASESGAEVASQASTWPSVFGGAADKNKKIENEDDKTPPPSDSCEWPAIFGDVALDDPDDEPHDPVNPNPKQRRLAAFDVRKKPSSAVSPPAGTTLASSASGDYNHDVKHDGIFCDRCGRWGKSGEKFKVANCKGKPANSFAKGVLKRCRKALHAQS